MTTFTLREIDWKQTPTNLLKWQEKLNKKAIQSIVEVARINWASDCVKLWRFKLKFEAFLLSSRISLKFSVSKEVCQGCGWRLHQGHPSPLCKCLSNSLLLKPKLKGKKSNLKRILKEKSKLLNLFSYRLFLVVLICCFRRSLLHRVYLLWGLEQYQSGTIFKVAVRPNKYFVNIFGSSFYGCKIGVCRARSETINIQSDNWTVDGIG